MKERLVKPMILDLRFKGLRHYLHGTDMVNTTMQAVLEHLQPAEISDVEFSFHRQATKRLKLSAALPDASVKPAAVVSFTSAGQRTKLFLVETDEAVDGRYAYDESVFAQGIVVVESELAGTWRDATPYSDIETWVGLTKALHQRVFPTLEGQWLFVRCKFSRFDHVAADGERRLAIISNFQNRLTRTLLSLNDRVVGEIHFSLL